MLESYVELSRALKLGNVEVVSGRVGWTNGGGVFRL